MAAMTSWVMVIAPVSVMLGVGRVVEVGASVGVMVGEGVTGGAEVGVGVGMGVDVGANVAVGRVVVGLAVGVGSKGIAVGGADPLHAANDTSITTDNHNCQRFLYCFKQRPPRGSYCYPFAQCQKSPMLILLFPVRNEGIVVDYGPGAGFPQESRTLESLQVKQRVLCPT